MAPNHRYVLPELHCHNDYQVPIYFLSNTSPALHGVFFFRKKKGILKKYEQPFLAKELSIILTLSRKLRKTIRIYLDLRE